MLISLLPPLKCSSYLVFYFAVAVTSLSDTTAVSYSTSISNITTSTTQSIFLIVRRLASHIISERVGIWNIMQIVGICATIPALFYIQRKSREDSSSESAQWQPISSKPSGEIDRPMDKGKQNATGKQVGHTFPKVL